MDEAAVQAGLSELLHSIERCNSLDDLGQAIDSFDAFFPYQIAHIGVGQIDNVAVRDVIYMRALHGTNVSSADFDDDLKNRIMREAVQSMKPFDLVRHDFGEDTALFQDLRKVLSTINVDGAIVMPFQVGNAVAVMIINCPYKTYIENMYTILPIAYQILAAIFKRFPKLAKWPEEFRLTQREAEILQLTASGLRESEIAQQLKISDSTVRNHIQNSKEKLDARNKLHAVTIATRFGEIDPPGHA